MKPLEIEDKKRIFSLRSLISHLTFDYLDKQPIVNDELEQV